jgi:hypothetical protein
MTVRISDAKLRIGLEYSEECMWIEVPALDD